MTTTTTTTQTIRTDGGAHVGGDVTGDHIFIGRDQYNGYSYDQVVELFAKLRDTDKPTLWNGDAPYVGLVPFGEGDTSLFAGREALAGKLIEALRQSQFVSIAGASGSGQTSLARAGVLGSLRHGKLPGSDKWLIESLTPRNHPIEQLAQAMSALASRAGLSSSEGNAIRKTGLADPMTLQHVANLVARGTSDQRVLLFIDQFEELFTQTQDAAERTAFVKLITAAAQPTDGRIKILLATRSDFLDDCAQYDDLHKLMSKQLNFVGAMDRDELARAIAFPAHDVGVQIDPALVEKMIADTKGESGALPLVQFALRDLFESQPRKKGDAVSLTLVDYLARGGIGQALQRHADDVFAKFSPTQVETAQAIFSRLIDPGKGIRPVPIRRRATEGELIGPQLAQAEITPVVEALVAARLVTIDEAHAEAPDGHTTLTLIHEQLIDAWPWLQDLVEKNRGAIAVQNQLGDDAQVWQDRKRDPAYVYVGDRLRLAQSRLVEARLMPSGLSNEYLAAGQIEEYKRIRALHFGQAAGIGLSTGIGYGLAFALAALFNGLVTHQDGNFLSRFVAFVLDSMIPVGAVVGFCIGLMLWVQRDKPRANQVTAVASVGATMGALAYLLYAIAIYEANRSGQVALTLTDAAAGALLGGLLGLGIGASQTKRRRLTLLPAFGAFGMVPAGFVAQRLPGVDPLIALGVFALGGVLLGTSVGIGYQATAVRNGGRA